MTSLTNKEGQQVAVNPVMIDQYHKAAMELHDTLLKLGVTPDQARHVLPNSLFLMSFLTPKRNPDA